MRRNALGDKWRALILVLLAQIGTYRQRLWEPLLIVVAVFIASAGLTAVTLINFGAKEQVESLTVGPVTVREQVKAREASQPLTQADYARLRRLGMDFLVAFVETSSSGDVAVDTLALLKYVPPGSAQPTFSGQTDTVSGFSGAPGLTDINDFYQGEVTPENQPLSGLAVIEELTAHSRQRLNELLPEHLHITAVNSQSEGSNLSDSFSLNLWAMGMLMVLVSLVIVFNALNLLLAARTPMLVKLRQLGVQQSILLLVLLLEMLLLGAAGAVPGTVAGAALITTLTPILSTIYQLLFDSGFSNPRLSLGMLLANSGFLSLAAVGAVTAIAFRRIKHRLTLRHLPITVQQTYGGPQSWLLLAGAITGLLVGSSWLQSQLAALVFIGLVLLVGCASVIMVMPVLLSGVAKVVPENRPLLYWSAHNAIALSRRTKLAACAFFIALSANIGMNVMVDSFRTATQSWLEQRLFAPLYVYTNHEGDLSARQDVPVNLLARYGKDVRLTGQKTELRSYPQETRFQRYLKLDKQSPDAWALFNGGQGVFINQQLAYRQNLNVGDVIDVPVSDPVRQLQVVGVYPDYGNPHAQMLLPGDALRLNHNNVTAYAVMTEQSAMPALKEWLSHVAPDARLLTRETLIEQSMLVFSRTFATTNMLNMVTMLVAALSFFVSITLLVLDIRPQLVLLRSIGVGEFSIKMSLFGQYCFIAISCAMVAIPFALSLAWLLVAKVNRFAFQWTYPLILQPAVILQSLLVGLGVLCVLLLLPLGRLKAKFTSQQEAY